MKRVRRWECQFPNCTTEIKSGATMCSKHISIIFAVARLSKNKHKSRSELLVSAVQKQKEINQRITMRRMAWEEGGIS